MPSAVETAIRSAITAGMTQVARFNRARATTDAPHPYLTGIHAPMAEELTLEDLAVTGTIPETLNGTYLRIGPNPVGAPNPARYHWFTGDGMVHGVRIAAGRAAWYRNRWVRTTAVSAALGEPPAPGPRQADFAVNTNIIGHAGRLWALVEAGANPVELSPMLETIAHNPFDGSLQGAFSAHPHRDPATGELHAICYRATELNVVHHVVVGTDGRVRREEPIPVNHGPSIHDCAITPRFVLVFDLPVTFSMAAMLAGFTFPYRWNDAHPARVGLLPREGTAADIVWCDVDPCYLYHPANAYDMQDGRVVVDVCVHNRNGHRDYRGPDAEQVRLERWTIDPASRHVARKILDDTSQEFPRIDERLIGLPHRYIYSVQAPAGPVENVIGETRLLKHDTLTGQRHVHDFGPGHLPGEFVFVPRAADADEDDGWLMGLVVDVPSDTTRLMILNARDFEGDPVASILLPHRVPPGFHGNWVPAA